MEKLVGVLLPVYKNDNPFYFKESVESILNQTYKRKHIFIGIDGIIEGDLAKYVKEYEVNRYIKVIYFKRNRGLAYVLNDLIDEAKKYSCDFYARMDADDISVEDRFEKQVTFLLKNNNIDVLGGAIEEIDVNSNQNGKKVIYPFKHKECRSFFEYRDPLAHPAVMFSKTFFEKVKGYRNEYRKNQDTMLWFDGFMNGCEFANLNDTILYFRVTSAFFSNRRNGFKRAKKMFQDRIIINKSMNYGYKAYVFTIFSFLLTISPSFIKKIAYKLR